MKAKITYVTGETQYMEFQTLEELINWFNNQCHSIILEHESNSEFDINILVYNGYIE